MCLAIYKKAGAKVLENHLANAFEANNDGAGFAAAVEGKIVIEKGFFKFEDFYKAWEGYVKYPALIHFRMATHGSVTKENCHPFSLCDGEYALIHNGVLNIESTNDESDTAIFAKTVVEKMLKSGVKLNCPAMAFLVEEAIGSGNKIAVMDRKGKATIWNKEQGHWDSGVWYSNACYKYAPSKSYFGQSTHCSWQYNVESGIFEKPESLTSDKSSLNPPGVLWDDLSEENWKEMTDSKIESQIPESDLAYYRLHGFTEEQIIDLTMREGEYCG